MRDGQAVAEPTDESGCEKNKENLSYTGKDYEASASTAVSEVSVLLRILSIFEMVFGFVIVTCCYSL